MGPDSTSLGDNGYRYYGVDVDDPRFAATYGGADGVASVLTC